MNIEQKTITSVEVAEMVEKDHKNILRDIRGYAEELGELKIEPSDFFTESTYQSEQNKILPCYLVTKKGCEFIAHKLTGIKGTEFTAKYINRFHDMEETIKIGITQKKADRTEVMMINARNRTANTYLKMAAMAGITDTYKHILVSKAAETLSGEKLLPLPKVENKTYSAEEVGNLYGITANMVGRIANKHGLKQPEYGSLFHDKSRSSSKEVETWRYNDNALKEFAKILSVYAK